MGQLLDDRTLIKMRMLGRGFERLTLIVEVCTDKNQERFRIDYPSGFRESADGGDPWQLVFEFTGRDKVPYRFKTTGGRLEGDAVWLPMPDFIERRQRRRHFRVETDMGSRLFFRLEEVPRELNLINVSLSGALGTLVRLKKEVLKTPPMAVGHFLEDVRLVFPGDAQEVCVSVEKAVVRRVEKTPKELFAYEALARCSWPVAGTRRARCCAKC